MPDLSSLAQSLRVWRLGQTNIASRDWRNLILINMKRRRFLEEKKTFRPKYRLSKIWKIKISIKKKSQNLKLPHSQHILQRSWSPFAHLNFNSVLKKHIFQSGSYYWDFIYTLGVNETLRARFFRWSLVSYTDGTGRGSSPGHTRGPKGFIKHTLVERPRPVSLQ